MKTGVIPGPSAVWKYSSFYVLDQLISVSPGFQLFLAVLEEIDLNLLFADLLVECGFLLLHVGDSRILLLLEHSSTVLQELLLPVRNLIGVDIEFCRYLANLALPLDGFKYY